MSNSLHRHVHDQRGSLRSFCLAALTLLLSVAALTQVAKSQLIRNGFCVHGAGVNFPIDQFLLVRKGDQLGAIKLTGILPDTQNKPKASEWLGTVNYESYFTSNSKAPFAFGPMRSDKLVFGRIKGFGFHYSHQSGNLKAQVGPWGFWFFYPNGMFMTSVDFWSGVNHDSGLEFAPTSAKTVGQLDPNDSRLHWYHYDGNSDFPCPLSTPPLTSPTAQALVK
jgi:hypothetical protein